MLPHQQLLTIPPRRLTPYTAHNSSSDGVIQCPMMMLSDFTPPVIKRYADCAVTLTGFLTTAEGKQSPFEVIEEFKYESDSRCYTLWQLLLSV